ncbi:hypothetical protein [Opitutus sp. ER46]|uniref:alpha/beta hydrolase n=1 Tax=Opitutus sp. ER46 TaxID=2161864 RepID=UPI000D303A5D|nr:hypothetical protein [Opitutus sp. ER46]PTX91149.1 hypothetical protein DB354_21180 [Opitutus sp. ER46]
MRPLRRVLLLCALLAPCLGRADVALGDSEAQVLAELGAPTGSIVAGPRKRLTFPQGAITFRDGKVAEFDRAMAEWLERRRRGEPSSTPATAPESPEPLSNSALLAPAATRRGARPEPLLQPLGAPAVGIVPQLRLTTRLHSNLAGYFTGDARRAWAAYAAQDKTEPVEPALALEYAPGTQAAFLYVPPAYTGREAFGVCVDVRPVAAGGFPREYAAVCDERRLIWVSPYRAGNDAHSVRRCLLALDALTTVRQLYRIDERRIYAGGFSGGAMIAAELALLFPELFRGAVIRSRGVYLLPVRTADHRRWASELPFLAEPQLRLLAGSGLRIAFVSGTRDPNFVHVQRSVTQWNELGFATKGFEVPELGHDETPAATFAEALRWLDGSP